MEENIKTIKERLSIIESLCTDDCINKTTVIQPLKYAIENLIKRNKELKDILKERQEDKERIEELEDIKNKAIGHIECCKTALGYYILSPSEAEYLLHLLKGDK